MSLSVTVSITVCVCVCVCVYDISCLCWCLCQRLFADALCSNIYSSVYMCIFISEWVSRKLSVTECSNAQFNVTDSSLKKHGTCDNV